MKGWATADPLAGKAWLDAMEGGQTKARLTQLWEDGLKQAPADQLLALMPALSPDKQPGLIKRIISETVSLQGQANMNKWFHEVGSKLPEKCRDQAYVTLIDTFTQNPKDWRSAIGFIQGITTVDQPMFATGLHQMIWRSARYDPKGTLDLLDQYAPQNTHLAESKANFIATHSRKTRPLILILAASLGAASLFLHAKPKSMTAAQKPVPSEDRLAEIRPRVLPALEDALKTKELRAGMPISIRIFKESSELEIWMAPQPAQPLKLFKIYPILTWGQGTLGPKLKEGDGQAPEGFYTVTPAAMNPKSNYHLAFNIGYPNAFDKALGRTGSFIMVHGRQASIGCFAMGDPAIEEIYLLAEAAFATGQQSIQIQSYPFRMTPERMEKAKQDASTWLSFWKTDLLPRYQAFEKNPLMPQ